MEEYDLLQCINKALDEFGSSIKYTIFWRMAILHNSKRSEVISDPRVFVDVIEELLGSGAAPVELAIIREIRKTFDISEDCSRTLAAAINFAKEHVICISSAGYQALAPMIEITSSQK